MTTTTEDQTKVLDAIQLYLESADEPEQKRVHGCFSKILATYGAKHPMFRAMTGNAKKVGLSRRRCFFLKH